MLVGFSDGFLRKNFLYRPKIKFNDEQKLI